MTGVFERLGKPQEPMPWGGYDFKKKTLAVVASDEKGCGVVLWSVGPHIEMDRSEHGLRYIDDLGLDPEGVGIWIWEGVQVWTSGSYEHPEEVDSSLEGTWRRPTDEEWEKIKQGECPWNDDDWLDPKYKDQILGERQEESPP